MEGGCLCGQVRYVLRGEIAGINFCHCVQCRKAGGSAFGTSAAVTKDSLDIVRGREHLKAYESTPGKLRRFCGHCGSPLYSERLEADTVYLRLGSLDDDPGVKPEVHIHVASKAPWYDITDDLPQLQREEGLWF